MFQPKVVEEIKTLVSRSITIFLSENRAVHEIMLKNMVKAGQAKDDNIIRRMRITWWIPKATDTHSEYVIFIVSALQQWFHGSGSILRYKQTACVCFCASKLYLLLGYKTQFQGHSL
jgi:hypothetical protein